MNWRVPIADRVPEEAEVWDLPSLDRVELDAEKSLNDWGTVKSRLFRGRKTSHNASLLALPQIAVIANQDLAPTKNGAFCPVDVSSSILHNRDHSKDMSVLIQIRVLAKGPLRGLNP